MISQSISSSKEIVCKGRRAKWWTRKGSPRRGFTYWTCDGKQVKDAGEVERVTSLVIPPAWRDVRINPHAGGKIQAIGIDARGRVQYLYHAKFAEARARKKFAKIETFGEYMPVLRKVTNEHIGLDGFPREKVLAIMTRLINSLYIRIGTDRSVREYRTYGITTLGKRHVSFKRDGSVIFEFVGKSKIHHRKVLMDEELAVLVKDLTAIGRGRKLFQYLDDDGRPRAVTPTQINAYIKSITAPEYSAKDFRTWGATMLAALEFADLGPAEDDRQVKKNIVAVVKSVAERLGNTPTVCRSSYIHPLILKAYEKGITIENFTPIQRRHLKRYESEFEPAEVSLLEMFRRLS
ncbi:MAG: DNA topoisomerase IB [Acidobacteria bacterium]|nr:DNA topoisomerase IB [Acidobacteriota bacterium]